MLGKIKNLLLVLPFFFLVAVPAFGDADFYFEFYNYETGQYQSTFPFGHQNEVIVASQSQDVRQQLPIDLIFRGNNQEVWKSTIPNDPQRNCRGADGCSVPGPVLPNPGESVPIEIVAMNLSGQPLATYTTGVTTQDQTGTEEQQTPTTNNQLTKLPTTPATHRNPYAWYQSWWYVGLLVGLLWWGIWTFVGWQWWRLRFWSFVWPAGWNWWGGWFWAPFGWWGGWFLWPFLYFFFWPSWWWLWIPWLGWTGFGVWKWGWFRSYWIPRVPKPWWYWTPFAWFIPWLFLGLFGWGGWGFWWSWIWWISPWTFWVWWWLIVFKEKEIWMWGEFK